MRPPGWTLLAASAALLLSAAPSAAQEQLNGAETPPPTEQVGKGVATGDAPAAIPPPPPEQTAPPAQLPGVDPVPQAPILETVVVSTPEERTAGSIHTIKSDKLERFELDDAHAILQSVPGVYARGEDGIGLRPNIGLRGANADRSKKVTLLEDGILLGPAPYSAPAAYYFPLMTRMESVRVVKGPAAIATGPQTVGGAIDLITREIPYGTSGSADLSSGQYLSNKAHVWFGSGNADTGFVIEGVHLGSDGFKHLDGGGDTGFARNEWMLKGQHAVDIGSKRNLFSLKLGYSDEVSHETYLGLTDADFRADPLRRYAASAQDRMDWHRTQVTASHHVQLGRVTFTTTAYRNDFHRVWRKLNRFRGADLSTVLGNPTSPRNEIFYSVLSGQSDSASADEALMIGPNKRDFVSEGIQTVARATVETGPITHSVEVQGRFHFDSIERLHTEDAFLMRGGKLVPAGEPTSTVVSNRDWTRALALHALDSMSWGRLTLTPGLRVELIRSGSIDRVTQQTTRGATDILLPGMGAHWALLKELGLFAGVYRGFSPAAPGQSGVKPETSINTEMGVRWSRRQMRVELIGFYNDYSNLTDICTFSSGCTGTNLDRQFDAGNAQIWGIEGFTEKAWRLGPVRIPISAAYTLTRTRLLQSFTSTDPQLGNVRAGDELPYVPRHQLNVSAGLDVWRVGLHAQLNFIGPMRERAAQGALEPGFTTDPQRALDLHADFRLTRWAQLYVNARNALSYQGIVARRPFGARPNAPRIVLAGLKLSY